jgi:hypothetical protein
MTANKKYYVGIGSRESPQDVLDLMTRVAKGLEKKRYRLRSGDALGADRAFQSGATHKDIFPGKETSPLWTNVFTDFFHPNPSALKDYGRKLMNRNAMQILGRWGDNPVDFVVCWTKDGKASGGTGHALRIAEYYNIPVFNLKNEGALNDLKEFING